MQSNGRRPDLVRVRAAASSSVSCGAETKPVRKVQARKVPYRVGYSWNRGGRLKELRIRHLARKFLKIWIQRTFGRVLPHEARSHYESVALRRAFEGWKDEWWASRREWSLTMRAECHHRYYLYNLAFRSWRTFVTLQREKKSKIQDAESFADRQRMRLVWDRWEVFTEMRRMKNRMLQSALELNRLTTLHSAWSLWQIRLQQQQNLYALEDQALKQKALTLQSRMTNKYWKLWQDRLEEAEDECFQPQRETAATTYSTSLMSGCFHYWREKLAERRHMQELERRANMWFAERMLPLCFNSWIDFTLQRRLHERRKRKAEVYNRQRQYTWVFYTWWGHSEKHKEQMLSERMAILHEERCRLGRAWSRWRERAEQRIKEEEKQEASERLYLHRLLRKTVTRWKDNSNEMRHRRNQEQQACRRGDLRCMRWAVEKWKQFVQSQRVKRSRLKQMQRYHQVKLLKRTFVAWKVTSAFCICMCYGGVMKMTVKLINCGLLHLQTHRLQISQVYAHAEELYTQHKQNSLRKALSVWRENAVLLADVRLMEGRARDHFQHFLRLKVIKQSAAIMCKTPVVLPLTEPLFIVFFALNLSRCFLLGEKQQHVRYQSATSRGKQSAGLRARLLRSLRRWRKRTREARRERVCMEKARRHHESKLLSKAMKAWNVHHSQYQKNKVMKRQGIILLRLKMYQTYFELWKVKVLHGWRLLVTEQRRKQEQAARAAEAYRDQLLREGVSCILTYAAHMNDLTTSLTQHSQEQRLRHSQRVVRRCFTQWKQRALCKARSGQEVKGQPPRKSVTFCLDTPGVSDSAEQEDEVEMLSELAENQSDVTGAEAAPEPSQLSGRTVLSCHHPAQVSPTSTDQTIIISNVSPSEPHRSTTDSPHETQDILLPPSAFMTIRAEDKVGTRSSGFRDAPPEQRSFLYSERLRASCGKAAVTDPASALTSELLNIRLEMKTYQQDRKQLRAWQKLREVLQSWLQSSGKDEQVEKHAVCQELKELEERIDRLSTELETRKPIMLLHRERIQHLQTVLTDLSVFTTLQEIVLTQSKSDDTC
ncbi:Protein SFI1-like protein [Nibea albiflora]|uniref:Protein SFI1-like protein n=1 Tax=Nibea albiflora TaxID=240163 RepID=A0ACB7EZW6_NIBAL|nr:Protein SFI1-like protein [Nibea albiflora]